MIPGGGVAYDILKEMAKRARYYYMEQNEIKLEQFFKNILSDKNKHLLEKEFTEEDYYLILKKLIQEDDNEKVKFYSNLMEGIIEK